MKPLQSARQARRRPASACDPAGFSLIETVLGLTVLAIIAVALGGLLASSVVTYGQSRERTLATQLAAEQVELVRRMSYDEVGLVNGNPPGTLQATRAIDVVGLKATMKVQVNYVDDQTPNAYRTYANYKRVIVTVVRTRDSKQLARESTYVSSASRASAEESIIKPTVLDLGNNTPVAGATVNLSTGPSAPRVDVTDASGKVTFPGLTPNPSSGAQAYYDLSVTPPSGYEAFRDDISPNGAAHVQLGVANEWVTTLRLYRPSTINVNVAPPAGVPYTISVGSGRGAQAFDRPAGSTAHTVTSITSGQSAAEPLVPAPSAASSSQYMVGVSAVSGGNYYYSTAVAKTVPNAYPTDLTQAFSLAAGTWYTAAQVKPLTVKVQNSSGTAINGAQVAVSGGPGTAPGIYVTGVTSTNSTSSTLSSGTISGGAGYSSGAVSPGSTISSGTISSQQWSSGAWYTSISSNCKSQTAWSCTTTPAAGTITGGTFSFGSAIGGSSSYSVALYKNTLSQGTCTIDNNESTCTISGLSTSVNGSSDTIVLVVTRTSGSGTSYTGTATASAAMSAPWGAGTWHTSISANCVSQAAGSCTTVPAAGTVTGASFTFASAIASNASYSVSLDKNGTSQGTCTIGNSGTACTISGLNVPVNGTSDTVVVNVTQTAGTSYTGTASATLTQAASWSSGNWYTSVSADCRSQTAGSCTTTPAAGSITSAAFSFGSAIASNASYSVTLYKNGSSTGSSCTIGNSQTGCTISGLNVSVNGTSDTIVLAVNRTSGSGTSYSGTASASAGHTTTATSQVVFNVPSGSGYTITAWGPTASTELTGQTVTSPTTKTLTVS